MGKKKASQPKSLDIPQRPEEDRRAQQAVRFGNILGILERLLQRSKWNVKRLAADLELSERTVHRYLDVLEIAGVPFHYDNEEKCYRVRPGYTFPILNLTPDELLGQATATVISEAVGLDPAVTARAGTAGQEFLAWRYGFSTAETLHTIPTTRTEVPKMRLAWELRAARMAGSRARAAARDSRARAYTAQMAVRCNP